MLPLYVRSAVGITIFAAIGLAQQNRAAAPYKVIKTVKVGGVGGFDYVYADVDGRRLYIPRPGASGARITVFDLDSLAPVGEIPGANAGVWLSIPSRITVSPPANQC